jgi:hypothetical protein
MEPFATGVFRSLKDAQLYYVVFEEQSKEIRQKEQQYAATNGLLDVEEDVAFTSGQALQSTAKTWPERMWQEFVALQSERVRQSLTVGDIYTAAVEMLQMNAVLSQPTIDSSEMENVSLSQLKAITTSEVGCLRAVRDEVESLISCIGVFLQFLEASQALQKKESGISSHVSFLLLTQI